MDATSTRGPPANVNIITDPQALRWGIATLTTIGHGDFYPVRSGGDAARA
jgi:hypothetical protein